jgi:hypothetical protein
MGTEFSFAREKSSGVDGGDGYTMYEHLIPPNCITSK